MYSRKNALFFHALIIPGIIMLVIFHIVPMFGYLIAFQKYMPAKGILNSPFVGLQNFKRLFMFADFRNAVGNTLIISILKIIFNVVVPVFFALVLNECRRALFKRTVQTIVYLPHFLSWVVLATIFTNVLSFNGIFNRFLALFGTEPILWLIKPNAFRAILVITDVWKNFGYNAIVYLAAITNIDQNIYEACDIDGANRIQRIYYMTLPSIIPTIILMSTISLGHILSAGFDQVYNMYSPLVYSTGDIIDTYVYRVGLVNLQFSISTAVSLIKSIIGFALLGGTQYLSRRFAKYSVF